MAERAHGRQAPQTQTTVRGEDWYAKVLSGCNHERVEFIDIDMMETTNEGGVFTDCTFRGVRFNVSVHSNAAFVNCTFVRCTFFDSSFTGCKLTGSMFDDCTFGLLKVSSGDWSFTGLPGADLRGAEFLDVRMREADLTGARCEGATLRRVDLSGAWLHNANLSRCDLRGSVLDGLDPLTVALKGAKIDTFQAVAIATGLGLDVQDA
jgi:fluoroquinolone resistance protein